MRFIIILTALVAGTQARTHRVSTRVSGSLGSGSADQKCGAAVNTSNDPERQCQQDLWGPTGDHSMYCYAYGGPQDPCAFSVTNDAPSSGLDKNPSGCKGDTLYLWDEPDTQGSKPGYDWAGKAWLEYADRFSQELTDLRAQGIKVTSPLLSAGGPGVIQHHMKLFMDSCGPRCSNKSDHAYIDVIAVNAFLGNDNTFANARGSASWVLGQVTETSAAFNDRPVYITNWAWIGSESSLDKQKKAIDVIDAFFPTPDSVIKRVYWFGATDVAGAGHNFLSENNLGEVWRTKCATLSPGPDPGGDCAIWCPDDVGTHTKHDHCHGTMVPQCGGCSYCP